MSDADALDESVDDALVSVALDDSEVSVADEEADVSDAAEADWSEAELDDEDPPEQAVIATAATMAISDVMSKRMYFSPLAVAMCVGFGNACHTMAPMPSSYRPPAGPTCKMPRGAERTRPLQHDSSGGLLEAIPRPDNSGGNGCRSSDRVYRLLEFELAGDAGRTEG